MALREGVLAGLEAWPVFLLIGLLWACVAGFVGRGLGVANLFRDDLCLLEPSAAHGRARRWFASSAFWTHAAFALLFALLWITFAEDADLDAASRFWPADPSANRAALVDLLRPTALVGLLGLLAAHVELSRPRIRDLDLGPRLRWIEMARCAGGLVLGLAAVAAIHALARAGVERAAAGALPTVAQAPIFWVNLVALALAAVALSTRKALPCLAIAALVAVLAVAVGALGRFAAREDLPPVAIALALVLWLVFANRDRFKLQIPGFEAYYPKPLDPNDRTAPEPRKEALTLTAPLDGWMDHRRRTLGADAPKPVMVLVATSGGAYRASFWTALLLDALSARADKLPGFGEGVRLITGASGGMVAGAYFAALAAKPDAPPPTAVRAAIEGDLEAYQRSSEGLGRAIPIPRDSLSPVVRRIVRTDIPSLFWPGRLSVDRGRELDAQWTTLHATFADLRDAEAAGRAPSLILSPMLVESGAPAFLSNLDLGALRGGQALSAATRNQESVELFSVFPEAWRKLTLATAVRLNASFPYISPAISLPTVPTRRVVDAGYYDNYGVDVATAWLLNPDVRKWIVDHCAGVAVIEVRAFPTGRAGEPKGAFGRAFRWLTSPFEGLFAARASSQAFRNAQQMALAERLYDEDSPGFLRSFAFEAMSEDVTMSWYTPQEELAALERLLIGVTGDRAALDAEPDAALEQAGLDVRDTTRYRAVALKLAEQFDLLCDFWARRRDAAR